MVVDCRWIGLGGIGRVTELLVSGIRARPGACEWVLWGHPRNAHLAGGAVDWVDERSDPRRRFGQAGRTRIPQGDVTVFMCQTRPLALRRPCVVVVCDTIQVDFAPGRLSRALRGFYLRRSARTADAVLTISEQSRDDIVRVLGVDPDRIGMLRLHGLPRPPVPGADPARRGDLLYVGSLAAHKNVPFLIRSFARSAFAAAGGTLHLVGGDARDAGTLPATLPTAISGQVRIEGRVSDDELEQAFAEADALVQASLAEGFGLPAHEARLRGLPLCHSGRGAMADITGDDIWVFDPTDEPSAARAIDAAIATGRRDRGWTRWRRAMRAEAPGGVGDLADDVARAARLALGGAS